MKLPFRSCSQPARFLSVAFSLAASLSVIGALMMPPAGIAATAVAVAQQPLILQPPIPPDIVLMLDDSGSMNANFMPDWSYLKNNSQYQAVIDASNNGVYYNPAATYLPPPHADGTTYASQTDMTAVPVDGFGAMTTQTVNLYTYAGQWECGDASNCGNGTSTSNNKIRFNTSVPGTTAATYSQTLSSGSACQAVYDSTPGAFGGITFNNGVDTTGSGNCTFQYYPPNYYFQYSTGPATGPYTVYYVAPASQGCGSQPNCVLDSAIGDGTNGAPAPGTNGAPAGGVTVGQNIANWFAYYHTRLLMAKSGVMTAFAGLDPGYRVGFGSINGRNAALISGFPNSYGFSTSTQSNNYLAGVAPFGKSSDPSTTAGIARFNFWSWIASQTANGTTPLRQALNAVGQYYSGNSATTPASNAWDWMASDPGYSTRGSAGNIACRQAYVILTTDGFWNGSYSSATTAGASNTAGPTFTPPLTQDPPYTGYTPADPFQGGVPADGSPSLADVAMYYWDHDLQTSLNNEVAFNGKVDPAYWQHMVTFTLGMGFTPRYADGTPIPMDQVFAWAQGGTSIAGWPGWPTPSANNNGSINNIADLAHAGVNGHGGFFSATDPQSFVSGLRAALNRTNAQTRTGASLASNSTNLTVGTVIFQAKYFPTKLPVNDFTPKWEGNLEAWSVNSVTGVIVRDIEDPVTHKSIPVPPLWSASDELPVSADRDIRTYNPNTAAFTAFKNGSSTPPDLSTAQLAALGANAAAREAMVDYLRGDATNEQQNNGTFRDRTTPLGDIVDSQPVFSGPPDPNEFINQTFYGTTVDSSTNTVPFYDWAVGTTDSSGFHPSAASQRTPMIFVAANDGMLHAFNATTGVETFAYLPGAVITAGLANLANPDYGSDAIPHQFYNDGQLTIADAYVKLPSDTKPQWHTILVGTTGRGIAKAVYALDVTNPGAITPLWERSAGDGKPGSNYIGQMVGKPVIAQTSYTQASGSTAASSTWSVLIGNGYNSASGQAALLQFNLATGALNVHTTTDTTAGNGLAAPVAWMGIPANGVSTVAYAGDLHGQVWKFPLNDATGSNPTPTSTGSLLFTAKDSGGKVQPITAGMLAGKDPNTNNVWLFFGTGQYLSSADLTDTSMQSWYGLIVESSDSKKSPPATSSSTRSNLVQRTITAQTSGGIGGSPPLPARTVSTQTVNTDGTTDLTGKSGWYLDLLAPIGTAGTPVQQGERIVDPNQFQGSLLIGVTRIPQVTDICNPSGSGWIMALDPFTGAAPSDDFFDVNNDGYVNGGDRVNGGHAAGVGFSSLPNAPIFVGGIMETSFDDGTTSSLKTAGTVGTVQRVNWRELVNP